MSNNGREVPWLNEPQHSRNRSQIPPEQLEPFAGQYVAFNWEGTQIVAHGKKREDVWAMLRQLGIDSGTVAFSYIPALDEDTWL